MNWLQRKEAEEQKDSRVDVQVHKRATRKAIAGVKKASDAFNQAFENNHFTLTIYLAAGGKDTQRLITKVPGEKKKTWKRTN